MAIKTTYRGDNTMRHSYDFKCDKCGEHSIVKLRIAELDKHKEICNQCETPMDRKITAPAFDADMHDGMKFHNLNWDL